MSVFISQENVCGCFFVCLLYFLFSFFLYNYCPHRLDAFLFVIFASVGISLSSYVCIIDTCQRRQYLQQIWHSAQHETGPAFKILVCCVLQKWFPNTQGIDEYGVDRDRVSPAPIVVVLACTGLWFTFVCSELSTVQLQVTEAGAAAPRSLTSAYTRLHPQPCVTRVLSPLLVCGKAE